MHGESQKSPFVVREMFFEAFGLERRRLVEVRVAERTEESQISLAKLGVPAADFFERRVVRDDTPVASRGENPARRRWEASDRADRHSECF